MLLVLGFAVGFVGMYVKFGAQDLWRDSLGDMLALALLAMLWGTPRGILERKVVEVLLGFVIAFAGLTLIAKVMESADFAHVVTAAAEHTQVATEQTWQVALNFAILGLFIGAIDGVYEKRLNKALIGALLSGVLGAGAAFVKIALPNAQETFTLAVNWGAALGLMHLGTVLTQTVCGSKKDLDGDGVPDDKQ
jgi:hypothetical protein